MTNMELYKFYQVLSNIR